jgi:N-methylhydantoinase B
VHDAVLGALMQAVPDVVPAGGASQVAVTYVSMQGSGAGGRVVSANPIQGGSGGSASIDGLSGSDRPLAYLRNVPTEILEFEGPVIVHRFGLVADSEGAGRNRGGFGVEFELELLHPEATLVTRGKDRHRFSAWGAQGGGAGTTCTSYARMPGSDEQEYLGKITVYQPKFGELVTLRGGGGGGYGDPFERDPEKVWTDVRAGLVSPGRAHEVYGVVLTDDGVDFEATMALRADAVRPEAAQFDFGPGRTQFMADYEAAMDTLRAYWWSLPTALRSYARTETWNRLNAGGSAPYTVDDANKVVAEFDGFLRERGLL